MKNKDFLNMSSLSVCHNSSVQNINFNSQRDFEHIKICRNYKFKEVWAQLEKEKTCFLRLPEKFRFIS